MSSLLSRATTKKSNHGVHPESKKVGGEIRPDYALTDRLNQWKHVTKSLLHYYQGLAAIEHTTSKSTLALQETIQVPFHEGHQFLGEGGWQEVLYSVRDQTKILADHHSALGNTIEKTVVKELEGVRSELKAHITAIEKEAGALADEVEKERATSASHLTQLSSGLDTFDNSSEQMLPQHDPYLSHIAVSKQLHKQVLKENDLQASIIRFQQQQPTFEENIAKQIQSACRLYDEAKATKVKEIEAVEKEIAAALQRVSPTAEYEYASSKPGFTIDPNSPARDVNAISFPGLNHPATQAIKEGYLERKKRFTKSYKESFYILSPSGYLHERRTNDPANTNAPGFSLFLPECSLGAPAKESDKSHKFHVEGNKAVKSSFESKVKNTLRFGGKEIAYTFRARTHTEMLGWWELLDKLSRDTKTAVESRTPVVGNPIAAAVANVGYAAPEGTSVAESTTTAPAITTEVPSGELHDTVPAGENVEEEDDEESGGSSAEEEEEEMAEARTAPSTPAPSEGQKAEVLPTYAGNPGGVSTAEKAALTEKGPVLGEPLPVNTSENIPTASTSA
ncbi:hypothetical protein BCR35DRAFT_354988 [Leucosporidium creatinivorum]|uniref:PH domain-containing protein n=1 Tax=Leucosporidium creatinivorum TaxID=106004 RepID=A0A1Y2DZA5_9BASI|nr:hypothetical protein BCR35DRAFT_354988 [Leucosporidium creatinivorum]